MKASKYNLTIIAVLTLLVYLFPLYWLYISSFKGMAELFAFPPTFFPEDPQFNFKSVFLDNELHRHFINSIIIASGMTAIVLVFSVGPAYVLSRYNNIAVDIALFVILLMQVLPPAIMSTPMYMMFLPLGLNDTYLGVIIAGASKGIPYSIILFRFGFMNIPKVLEDAGKVDGCTRAGVFFRIVLPLCRNHILVISMLNFLQGMGEYVYSKSLLSSTDTLPVTVIISNFVGPNSVDWTSALSMSVMYVTPIIIVFVFIQKKIVAGLTSGSVKG